MRPWALFGALLLLALPAASQTRDPGPFNGGAAQYVPPGGYRTGGSPGLAAVGALAPAAVGTTSVTLSWAAVAAANPVTYKVDYRLAGSSTWITFNASVSALTATIPGLSPQLLYDFEVIPSTFITGPASVLHVTTSSVTGTAPTAPTSVTVTAGAGFNTINGAPVTANPAVTGYSVYRGTTAGGESGTAIATNVALPYVDTAAAVGVASFYKLAAVNGVGSSPLSTAEGSGTPTAPVNTRARFAEAGATDGANTPATLFAAMTQVAGATTDRNGNFTAASSASLYGWVAVTQAAAGAGMRFFDGTGYGGFDGAQSTGLYTGPPFDPTTICVTYTDGGGTAWNFYRMSGHPSGLTITLQ